MSILIDKKLYITTFFLWIIRLTFWQSPHGDYEEHGETINLGENFKVEKIIFNCVEYNDLENKLIKILNKKRKKHFIVVLKN